MSTGTRRWRDPQPWPREPSAAPYRAAGFIRPISVRESLFVGLSLPRNLAAVRGCAAGRGMDQEAALVAHRATSLILYVALLRARAQHCPYSHGQPGRRWPVVTQSARVSQPGRGIRLRNEALHFLGGLGSLKLMRRGGLGALIF